MQSLRMAQETGRKVRVVSTWWEHGDTGEASVISSRCSSRLSSVIFPDISQSGKSHEGID